MVTIKALRYMVSKLSQKRYYLEKKIEQTGEMMPACLIMRYRETGTRDFQSVRSMGQKPTGRMYGYLTYMEAGVTRHRYVAKGNIVEVSRLTGEYREYCRRMQGVRQINKKIVEVLGRIGEIQKKEVSDYVNRRAGAKGRGK